ncbi:MAG: BMP family protein [Bacillota bacterium]
MKKAVSILMIALLVLAATACASPSATPSDSAQGDHVYRVAMIANAPIDDGGWNAACYAGMKGAAEIYGFETSYSESVAESDYVSTFTEYANMGVDLIFAPGNEFTDAVLEVAPNFPDVNFVILNGDVSGDNCSSIKCDNTQLGFLAGILAGLKTKTNHVGLVGGMEITPALQSVDGFEQGVAYTNPDAQIHVTWSNSWDDAALGKEIATSMITTNDVDVFFGLASAVDAGVREGAMQFENRYAIAQPSDYLSQAPNMILSSVVTDNVALIGMAMKQVKEGTFGGTVVQGGVADGVLSLGAFGTAADDIKDKAMQIFEDLRSGKIKVEYNA